MNPGKYTLGAVVKDKTKVAPSEFGHVIGFGRNESGELLIHVQWEYNSHEVGRKWAIKTPLEKRTSFIHPIHIEVIS